MMMKNVASKRNLALELILQLDLKVLKYHFGLKDYGENWSRKKYFEIPRAPSDIVINSWFSTDSYF